MLCIGWLAVNYIPAVKLLQNEALMLTKDPEHGLTNAFPHAALLNRNFEGTIAEVWQRFVPNQCQ